MSLRACDAERCSRILPAFFAILSLGGWLHPAHGQTPTTQPDAITQQAIDRAMARLRERVQERESQANPTTRPMEDATSVSLTEQQRRVSKVQAAFLSDLERARAERKIIASQMMPKGYSGAPREWAENKRANLSELDSTISKLQARVAAFNKMSDVELKRLLDEYESRLLARDKAVREKMTGQYGTIKKAGRMVLDQLGSTIQSARYVDGNDEMAVYEVTYISRDQVVRASKLRISMNAVSDPNDKSAAVIYYYPTGAHLDIPFESPQELPFKDPVPSGVTVDWDAKAGFRVVGGD